MEVKEVRRACDGPFYYHQQCLYILSRAQLGERTSLNQLGNTIQYSDILYKLD